MTFLPTKFTFHKNITLLLQDEVVDIYFGLFDFYTGTQSLCPGFVSCRKTND